MFRGIYKLTIFALISLWLFSCSNIKMLQPADIYSDNFLKRIEGIQLVYKDGDKNSALKKLEGIDDKSISPVEKAKKYNFLGIILFSNQDYEAAIDKFLTAEKTSDLDSVLTSQINLNLASSFYKKDLYQRSYEYLQKTNVKNFSIGESQNFYKLNLVVAQQLEKTKEIVISSLNLIGETKTFQEVEKHQYKDLMISNFRKLSSTERVTILDQYKNARSITTAYLAKEEALGRYYKGDREGAIKVLSWIDSEYSNFEDAQAFIKNFQFRIENYSKIDVGAIGVVLPLSGKKAKFGQKALTGVDSALNFYDDKILAAKIYARDSQNNPYVAKKMISDLIQKHHVSIIVGGLFPNTAKAEYLEAKKYGVMFVSLSPVHLKKEDKNHLLIEIPGSIESQVEKIMNKDFLEKFGNRVAMLYPETEGGLAYVNEVLRREKKGLIELQAVHAFDRSKIDFREPVSKVLNVHFKRERKEEFMIWNEIYRLEKKRSSIRRIQTLKPIIDFDWVFIPAYPRDAIQIIPTFSYFDAKKVKFVGGPSWLSRSIIREQRKLGKLFMVGIDPQDLSNSFSKNYKLRNQKLPRLIETLSFEAMNLSLKVIEGSNFEKREELETRLLNFEKLVGVTGSWSLKEGIWLKDMDFMQISRGEVLKTDLSVQQSN